MLVVITTQCLAGQVPWRADSIECKTFIGKKFTFCLMINVEYRLNIRLSSTHDSMDPNHASPPTHPPSMTLEFLAWRNTSMVWYAMSLPFGIHDFIGGSRYFFCHCSVGLRTMSWWAKTTFVHSTELWSIVPRGTGLHGSWLMCVWPPVLEVLGCHPYMDSSSMR